MKKICIFGDSVTWGMGLRQRVGWADLLRNHLEQRTDHYLELYNLGIDRDNSKDLLKRVDGEAEARKPDMIIILIGSNDSLQYKKGRKLVDEVNEDDFRKNLQKIIDKSKKYTKEIFLVGLVIGDDSLLNPLPRSTTGKRYTKKRISKYDQVIREVAAKNSIAFIDINKVLGDDDFADGLHPNERGHEKIYERLLSALEYYLFEQNTIVDKNDKVIGSMKRSNISPKDIYRVASLWIENSKGEVLLAQRTHTTPRHPNKWGPAVVDTVISGDSYRTTILRQAENTLGIRNVNFEESVKVFSDGDTKYFAQYFRTNLDLAVSDFKLDLNVIANIKWFDKEELKKLRKEKSDLLVPDWVIPDDFLD